MLEQIRSVFSNLTRNQHVLIFVIALAVVVLMAFMGGSPASHQDLQTGAIPSVVQSPGSTNEYPSASPVSLRFENDTFRNPGLSIFILFIWCVLQFGIYKFVDKKISKINNDSQKTNEQKLKSLANNDIYLDLPLYAGLFGSVLTFIILTIFPAFDKTMAYSSTAAGIIVAVILRTNLVEIKEELEKVKSS